MDVMMTVAVIAIMMAIAVPSARNSLDNMRLGSSSREVERELQTARMKAVASNRTMRLRFNCPSTGYFRIVELTNVSSVDADAERCDATKYGYPGPKDTNSSTPEFDGPLHTLPTTVTVSGSDLQFSPDGTTRTLSGSTVSPITGLVTITLTQDANTARISVNALGKIQLQ